MSKTFDAVIIGGGPAGYTAALRVSQLGGKVCLVEKNALGGVCANKGCIPTKFLTKASKTLLAIRNSSKFGITAENILYDIGKIKARLDAVVRKSTKGVEILLKASDIEVINGVASILSPGKINVYEDAKKTKVVRTLSTKNIVIATGAKPIVPKEFLNRKNIMTSENVFDLKEVPQNILIVGAGYIGLEFAFIFSVLGSDVVVVEKLPRILESEEEDVAGEIRHAMEKLGICVVTSARGDEIEARAKKADEIFVACGRRANFDEKEIKALGIKLEKDAIATDASMKTNVKGIYAAGDVNGKSLLAHTAFAEGITAAENIMGENSKMDYSAIPSTVFTVPEAASVGKKKGTSGKFPFIANGRASTMGETQGFVKVYADRGKLVGASIVGVDASSLIAVVQGLLGKKIKEIKKMIFAHPTLPEAVFEAIMDIEKQSINKPKNFE